jgi:hypothetical protein
MKTIVHIFIVIPIAFITIMIEERSFIEAWRVVIWGDD